MSAVLHRVEQRVVEALYGIAAARRRGMDRIGKHAETEPGQKLRLSTMEFSVPPVP
jgi:hypothetical protein